VVVHLSDHNPAMVAQVDYHIRAEQSINGKETAEHPVLTVYYLKMGECREVLGGGPAPPSKL